MTSIKDLQTLQDIDDNLQSQTDLYRLARERREEEGEDPQELCSLRELITREEESDAAARVQDAQQRHERRLEQPARARREGTAQELIDKYQALLKQIVARRRQRVQTRQRQDRHGMNEREREQEPENRQDGERRHKAAPPGVRVTNKSALQTPRHQMTIEQIRERFYREEDRLQRAQQLGLQYLPPHPYHEQDGVQVREYERGLELGRQAAIREQEQEEAEELQAQVAQQGSPQETILHEEDRAEEAEEPTEQALPVLPTDDGLTVNSSTSGSPEDEGNERGKEGEREHDTPVASPEDDEQNYWDNIVDNIRESWHDMEMLTTSKEIFTKEYYTGWKKMT
eukprot:5002812-Amphidinium_carterae.2